MITASPFKLGDVTHLADTADDASLYRVLAIYETASNYGISARPFEPTGTTSVLIATLDHEPTEDEVQRLIAPHTHRPTDTLLHIAYTFRNVEVLKGDALSTVEHRMVNEYRRDHSPKSEFQLPLANNDHVDNVVYPARWAPNRLARELVSVAAHHRKNSLTIDP